MPLTARLNVEVIDSINRAMELVRPPDGSREPEIGGLLLGRIEEGDSASPVVRLERIDLVDSEHRRGPSYVLSDRDKKVLARKLDWWNSHGEKDGLRPVGFFRSHTRRGLYLDNEDFAFFRHYFPEPTALFLLVRPTPGAASVGGYFFWDEGDMHRESSYQEFPFSPKQLPLTVEKPAPVAPPPTPVPAVAPPPVAPPPVARPPDSPQPVVLTPPPTARPAVMRRPATWLQVAAPLIIGVVLGAAIFELTKRSMSPPAAPHAARTQIAKPAPAKSAPPQPLVVEKPSPLEAKSRPVILGQNQPAQTAMAKPPAPKRAATADRIAPPPAAAAPTGSESHNPPPAPAAPPAAAVVTATVEAAPPPPASMPPITTPVRVERPHRAAVATVTVEPVSGSRLGRIVGHIPGFHHKQKAFVPARPIRQVAPSLPSDEHLSRDVPVDLRIKVDPAGNVAEVEQASHGADRELVRLASDAARGWQFVPARRNDETVSSELILHFMFPGSRAAEP